MAKQPLKRPAAKTAPKSASKPASKLSSKPAAKSASKPATKAASKPAAKVAPRPAAKVAAKPAKPSSAKPSTKTIAAKSAKPVNGKTIVAKPAKASDTKPTAAAKPVAAAKSVDVTPAANGKPSPTVAAKPVNGSKPANGAAVAAPAPAKSSDGRPMLMQGPVASKGLTKKGTFVLTKPTTPAPKLLPRKIEKPEPEFVTLQPPVAQVKTSDKAVKNRAGLNQKDLDFFRDLLLQKRRELVGDLSHMEREALRENNASAVSVPVDPTDQGTDAYEQEFTLGLVEKDRTLLREINDAMAKIQNGTYGICEGTGNPISRPRLEAQPWARHSIEFARILEKRKMAFRR